MIEPVETAVRAVARGGEILLRHFRNLPPGAVNEKSHNDLVSVADRESEEAILEILRESHPTHALLGEEGGLRCFSEGEPEAVWIADPLDGTANFVHGFPFFGVSVALRKGQEIVVAATLDPLRGDLWTAERGGGAFCNGEPIRASTKTCLDQAFAATGFPFRRKHLIDDYLGLFRRVFDEVRGIRRTGAAVLDLALVASGVFDLFFEYGLSPWDYAAGVLLIEEAGGRITDFAGSAGYFESGDVVAAGLRLHPQLLRLLADQEPEQP